MRVKAIFPRTEGLDLSHHACLIMISLGQRYHDLEAFRDSLKLLAPKNYGKYVFIIADDLQNYTKRMIDHTLSEAQAHTEAQAEGALWIERARPVVEEELVGKQYQILTWVECLSSPFYGPAFTESQARYSSDSSFHQSIETVVEKFLNGFRDKKKGAPTMSGTERARQEMLCRQYVMEETALIKVWQNRDCPVTWLPESTCFFIAYFFGGHTANKAVYEHLTKVCESNAYQLINFSLISPKAQLDPAKKAESQKVELAAGTVISMLKLSDLDPELQLAALALAMQKISNNKRNHRQETVSPVAQEEAVAGSASLTAAPGGKRHEASPPATSDRVSLTGGEEALFIPHSDGSQGASAQQRSYPSLLFSRTESGSACKKPAFRTPTHEIATQIDESLVQQHAGVFRPVGDAAPGAKIRTAPPSPDRSDAARRHSDPGREVTPLSLFFDSTGNESGDVVRSDVSLTVPERTVAAISSVIFDNFKK